MTLAQAHSHAKKYSKVEGFTDVHRFIVYDDSYGYGDDFYHVAVPSDLDTYHAGVSPLALYVDGDLICSFDIVEA